MSFISPVKALVLMAAAFMTNLAPSFASHGSRVVRPSFIAAIHPQTLVSWNSGSKMSFTRKASRSVTMSSEEAYIKQKISQPCVIFSKTYCPFCDMAKSTLKKEGAKFDIVELDVLKNGDDIQKTLAQMTGRRTVPNVFVGGKTIGGGDDTKALSASGKLSALLKEAGAM